MRGTRCQRLVMITLFAYRCCFRAGNAQDESVTFVAIPRDHRKPSRAVLLLAGGGPMNRDEQIGPNAPFAEISDALVRAGYAVLRYDKRGIGKSTNASASITRALLLDDAEAAVDLLRRDPKVDAAHVYAIGHSEGGELALGLARARPIRGVAMLAPLPKPYVAELHDQMNRLKRDRSAIADLIATNAMFFKSYDGIDPRREITTLNQPLLLLHGKKDVHVLQHDIVTLDRAAVRSKRNITYRELSDDNHFFMRLPGDRVSTGEEFDEVHHFDPRALAILVAWLNEH
jgi:pimeloyl-ACP methyl ester carboxylesterase